MRLVAVVALAWCLIARLTGPSDAWDQSQPRTMAYTIDIIVRGEWILPTSRGDEKATKPPLYNWLAAPAVWVMGVASEPAHKFPSMVSLVLCWLALVVVGERILRSGAGVGWLAATMFVSSYTIFKLGYLARPDMLLTLWLLLGWIAATVLLSDRAAADGTDEAELSVASRHGLRGVFWLCVALAALTKGPAALVLPVYGLLAAGWVGGRWRAAGTLGWSWGVPLSIGLSGWWVYAVWRIDPEHLREQLWGNEIAGRVTGTGPEGSREGLSGLLTSAPNMVFYYVVRFLPWSLVSLASIWSLWRRPATGAVRRWRALGREGRLLQGALLFVLVTIGLFSFSAGKRADYIATAFAPGALLAAWYLLRASPGAVRGRPWLGPALAGVVLVSLTGINRLDVNAPQRGFGADVNRFIRDAEAVMQREELPTVCWFVGFTNLQAFLGYTDTDTDADVRRAIERGEAFWLLGGGQWSREESVRGWIDAQGLDATIEEEARSESLVWDDNWPGTVVLYRVQPRPAPRPLDGVTGSD